MHIAQKELELTSIKKIVFLDFDGCLTNLTSDIGSYLTHSPEKYGCSKTNEMLLRKLCNDCNAKIVISSNWRRYADDGKWKWNGCNYINPLPDFKRRFEGIVVGQLPLDRHCSKCNALIRWFDSTGYSGKYVIFDDDENEGFQNNSRFNKFYIHCDYANGITEEDVEKAKTILDQ